MRLSSALLPAALLLAPACVDVDAELDELINGGGVDLDSDGDGITDREEAELGTDPRSTDSDGDGWLDADELDSYTDPTDAADKPYQGGWPIGACRYDFEDAAPATPAVGQVAPNFVLNDQFGDAVRLHDFCEQTVLFVTGAEWCGPCQQYRSEMAAFMDAYGDRGFFVVDLLGEDAGGGEPSTDTLVNWSQGHDYVVMADPGWAVSYTGYVSGGIPAMSLLGPGLEVVILNGYPQASDIEALLPQ
jgi:hypothetical protein